MSTEEKFARMCSELMDKGVREYGSFAALCAEIHADEMLMNNLFYENFGVSGEEAFNKFLCNSIVIAV